jgi:hypothetical protein
MSTELGEVNKFLSFSETIAIDDTFTSVKTTLQEFSSISVTVSADSKISMTIEFSNDAENFDYSVTNGFLPNSPSTITSVVIGKWCRIKVLNNGENVVNVRLSTYCSTQPSTVQSSINSIDDNFQSVNVDNWSATLNNEIRIAQDTVLSSHKFYYSTVNSSFDGLRGPDRTFIFINGGGANIGAIDTRVYLDRNLLRLSDISRSPLNAYFYVIGEPVNFRSGNPIVCNFSTLFDVSGYSSPASYDQFMIGMGYVDDFNGDVVDGVYLGYDGTTTSLSLIYYRSFIKETYNIKSWSFDSLDGNGPSRILLDPSKLSKWRIRTSYYGSGSIFLEYHNPFDNEWIPCHRIQNANLFTRPNFGNPSFSGIVYTKRTTNEVTFGQDTVAVGTAQITIGIEGGITNQAGRLQTFGTSGALNSIPSGVETTILGCRAGELLNQKVNRSNMFFFKLSVEADGTKPVTFKIYVATDADFTLPVWNYSPSQIISPGQGLSNPSSFNLAGPTAVTVFTSFVSKEGSAVYELKDFELSLFAKESIIVTALSANASEVGAAFTYGLIE